jgi:hypothetical protein
VLLHAVLSNLLLDLVHGCWVVGLKLKKGIPVEVNVFALLYVALNLLKCETGVMVS